MVAMIILAILVVAGVGSYTSSQRRSRDSKKKNDLRQVTIALETYYTDKGRYPDGDSEGRIEGCAPTGTTACEWGEIFQADTNGSIYMVALPVESDSKRKYIYMTDGLGASYQIYANLENVTDTDIPKNGNDESRIFTDLDCATGTGTIYCNYGLASTNITVENGRTISYE